MSRVAATRGSKESESAAPTAEQPKAQLPSFSDARYGELVAVLIGGLFVLALRDGCQSTDANSARAPAPSH